jgi:serine/threonine-protein kinase HipA
MDLDLQLFFADRWHDAGTISIPAPETGYRGASSVSYDLGYFADVASIEFAADTPLRDARAFSVDIPVDLEDRRYDTWPAFLLDLLPQGHQRERIAERLKLDPDAASSDIHLLLHAGGSPVGNLRIKQARDEEIARASKLPRLGISMQDILSRSPRFVELVDAYAMLASGSSGLQGNSPKVAMTLAADGLWYPDSTVEDAEAREHAIVKFARGDSAADLAILAAETPYLAIAREFGLNVHADAQYGDGVFVVPRFDRAVIDGHVIRHGQESMTSAAGIAAFGHTDSHENYLRILRRVSADPLADVTEYVLRDVLNLAMGNTDNHGRNTALRKTADAQVRLAPLFDFAPMRISSAVVARSTKWECMKSEGRDYNPDWEIVALAAAGGELPADEIVSALAEKAEFVRRIPEIAAKHAIAAEVAERAFASHGEIADGLAALAPVPTKRVP